MALNKQDKAVLFWGALIAFIVLALALDWNLYLFDRLQYLNRRAVEICTAAKMTTADYHECKTVGYRDKRCELLKALFVEQTGECLAAEAAIDAEEIRRRAR